MAIEIGAHLGPYEITGKLGAGGMGEVYRARDSRLNRDIALKVMPAEVAGDPARRTRFEQEARSAAALTHPNVVATYDIGDEDGVLFIVSELVEGESLDTLLARGQLPLKRVLKIAVELADGMAAAHAEGITHRDLKPANVMFASDGRAKILDFGLAKRSDRSVPSETDATLTVHQTQPGMVLGTMNYMSPEQASSKPVDPRSDQFSFGVILYEMVTGERPFERPTGVQTMSAVVAEEPPPLGTEVPSPLRWILERCLSKEPEERYESSRDLYRDLKALRDRLSEASTQTMTAVTPPSRTRRSWAFPAGVFAAGAILASAVFLMIDTGVTQPVAPPEFRPFSFQEGGQALPVWSPDGAAAAFLASQTPGGANDLYVRFLDEPSATRLTQGINGIVPLAWVEQKIYFYTFQGIASEDDDGESAGGPGIFAIASVGGEPERIRFFPETNLRNTISISPDAGTLAVMRFNGETTGVWTSSPVEGDLIEYQPAPFAAESLYNTPQMKFAPDGSKLLLYQNRSGSLEAWVLPMPAGSGQPRQVLQQLDTTLVVPTFSWMPDNRHVVVSTKGQLWIADTESDSREVLMAGTTNMIQPAVAPGGERLIFAESSTDADIVSINLSTAAETRVIGSQRNEQMPAWDPSGRLVYVSDRNGQPEIWLHTPDQGDRPVVTVEDFPPGTTDIFGGPVLSPDGNRLVYARAELPTPGQPSGLVRLWISALAGGEPVALTNQSEVPELPGSFSPDGSMYLYSGLESGGSPALYKVRTSGDAQPEMLAELSNLVPAAPVWSPDGSMIALADRNRLVLLTSDGELIREIETPIVGVVFTLDGRRLVGLRPAQGTAGEFELFSIGLDGGGETVLVRLPADIQPETNLEGSFRLSWVSGNQELSFGVVRQTQNLWLLEGLDPERY